MSPAAGGSCQWSRNASGAKEYEKRRRKELSSGTLHDRSLSSSKLRARGTTTTTNREPACAHPASPLAAASTMRRERRRLARSHRVLEGTAV